MILGYTLTTFPKVARYIFMHNPRRNKDLGTIARKGTLHNWWRISGHQVFYTAREKLNKDKEGGNSQPSKHPEKDNTKLCIIFLFYI